jgi:hypothetical protein
VIYDGDMSKRSMRDLEDSRISIEDLS